MRRVLEQPLAPAVRALAPQLTSALPVLRELVEGLEDLADRVSILETSGSLPRRQAGR